MDSSASEIPRRVRELCILLHTEMTAMHDSRSESSFMDISEVIQMDILTALDHIEAAIKELLTAKRQLLDESHYSALREQQQYCQALEKLEKEVRGHIQAEHQMALHIELLQEKISDLETDNEKDRESYQKSLERLQQEYDTLLEKLRQSEQHRGSKSEATSRTKSTSQRLSDVFRLKLRRINEPDMEKRLSVLEERLKKTQNDLVEQEQLCVKWRKECDDVRGKETCREEYRKRYEEKCLEVSRVKSELAQALKTAKYGSI